STVHGRCSFAARDLASSKRDLRLRCRRSVALMPGPGGAQDAVEVGETRRPVEQLMRQPRIGDERRRIAGPARRLAPRHAAAGDALDRGDDLANRIAAAGAEGERGARATLLELVERFDM